MEMQLQLLIHVESEGKQFGHVLRISVHIGNHTFIGAHFGRKVQIIVQNSDGVIFAGIEYGSGLDFRV
jgi:hypothetical protein